MGGYIYGEDDASPHALTTANGVGYFYDANGNMTSGNGRAINWYSFNKPYSIAKGTTTSTFMYGPDRARIQHMVTTGASTKMVKYLGTLYEKVTETAIYGCCYVAVPMSRIWLFSLYVP